MTVSLRAASPSQLRNSLAAVRAWLLLMLFAVFGGFASAQGLTPSTSVSLGSVVLGGTATYTIQLTAPIGGVSIKSVTAVTEGALTKDFNVVPTAGECMGTLYYPTPCTVEVSFTPTQIGIRLGALLITNTSGVIVNSIPLSGTGVGPQFVFAPTTAIATTTSPTTLVPGPSTFTVGAAVLDGNGNLFFTDVANGRILERSSAGGFTNVTSLSPLSATSGITIDGAGNLYVSSASSVFIIPSGSNTATRLTISNVTLSTPAGLAVDVIGDLYIADSTNNKVYQLPPGTTTANTLTFTSGPGVTLSGPTGLAVDSNNILYIADSNNNQIVENQLGTPATTALILTGPTLNNPTGVSVDAAGTVYIANTGGRNVIEATVTGAQFVLTDPALVLSEPRNVVIESNGDLVISDTIEGLVDVARSKAAINFPTPTVVGTVDATPGEDPIDLTVQDSGNINSNLTLSSTANNPSISTSAFQFGTATTSPCPILNAGSTDTDTFSPGEVCVYALQFKPTVVGLNSANLVFATTAVAGGLTTSDTIPLTGIGLSTITHFSLVAIPGTINKGGTVELILTALNFDGTVATDYVGTVTFTTDDSTGKYQFGPGTGTVITTYTFTPADNGSHTFNPGLQLNQYGTFHATATDSSYNLSATSNPIYVIEPTTLSLTSSINPSLVNQSTTFTLTVATTGSLTPTGTVSFFSNGVQIGSPVTLTPAGTASISDSFPAAGNYAITATYTPTNSTQGGTASLTQVVGLPTAVVLTSSINPSLVNQSTNLTATITAVDPPTGSVTFYNGATALGTVLVTVTGNTGTATFPASFATAGTYPLTAVYNTTSSYANVTNATSPVLSQVVQNLTSITLTSSVNPSQLNQSTTLTANLTALGTPTGTVKFYDGTNLIGTVNLTGTTASISVAFSTSGTHNLKAVYSGDTNTSPATATLAQVVLNVTTITLSTSVNPVLVNANTTLTSTVTSAGTLTGTVTFYAGANKLGTATITGGVASLVVSFPTPGIYSLTAVYSGDANNQTATSAPISQTVLNVTTVALTTSINPVLLDNPTILSAILTSTGPTPTGTVSFFDGGTPLGVVTLVNGTASISASFVYAGTHTITALYSGDTVAAPASAPALSQTVADFSFVVASGTSSSASTIAGGTAGYSLLLSPLIATTLPSAVTITVAGLPSTATFVLTPATVAAGSGATPVAFNVTAAQIVAAIRTHLPPAHRSPARYAPVALGFLALPLAWFRRRKRFGSLLASVCLLLAITGGLTGCISDPAAGYYGQTPQSYNVTVTATSGNLARSTYLTLTIQ